MNFLLAGDRLVAWTAMVSRSDAGGSAYVRWQLRWARGERSCETGALSGRRGSSELRLRRRAREENGVQCAGSLHPAASPEVSRFASAFLAGSGVSWWQRKRTSTLHSPCLRWLLPPQGRGRASRDRRPPHARAAEVGYGWPKTLSRCDDHAGAILYRPSCGTFGGARY